MYGSLSFILLSWTAGLSFCAVVFFASIFALQFLTHKQFLSHNLVSCVRIMCAFTMVRMSCHFIWSYLVSFLLVQITWYFQQVRLWTKCQIVAWGLRRDVFLCCCPYLISLCPSNVRSRVSTASAGVFKSHVTDVRIKYYLLFYHWDHF